MKLIEGDGPEMEIDVQLTPQESVPQTIKGNGLTFSRLPIEREGFQFGSEGLPEVPKLHRWVVVNANAEYRLEVVPGKYRVYRKIKLYPAQPDAFENEVAPFKMSPGAYLKNTWYGSRRAILGKKAKLGELTLLPISFYPASYNPRKRELRVYETIKVRLIHLNPELNEEPTEISKFAAEQAAQLTLNGDRLDTKRIRVRATKKMIVFHGPELRRSGEELAEIHRAQGTDVSLVEVPQETKAKEFQQMIKEEYQKQKMDAVLIFGDETAIPLMDSGGQLGDFYYGLVSGTDHISDVALGRLPAKNESQGKVIVNKIRKYQQLASEGYTNKRVMLVAHAEEYPGKYTKNMEEVRKSPNPLNLEFNTQYGGEKAKNSTVLEEAEKGYAIINYRGHGSASTWSGWGSDGTSFSTAQIRALPEEDRSLSFIFNVACTNGAIQNSSAALVERELFPKEDQETFQGAVGTFGATAPSLTEVNHRFNFSLFEYLQRTNDISIGNVYTLANNKLTKDNGGSSTSNTRMYVLYSDPLLSPWVNQGKNIQ